MMLVLGRKKGEIIEIENTAQIRIAQIEDIRIRIDITSPFCRAVLGESKSAKENSDKEGLLVVIKVLGIKLTMPRGKAKARLGIRVPKNTKVHRGAIESKDSPQTIFPWHRFRPNARYWREIGEEIHLLLPCE